MKTTRIVFTLLGVVVMMTSANAAYLLEVDTDGADDGVITFNPNFGFGGDTTTASQSIAAKAFGLTGGDSIFGGDGANAPDTYDPAANADNLNTTGVELGVDLAGNPVYGTGVAGGGTGNYRVYASWPATSNVSGGDTSYAGNGLAATVDQNTANDPDGDDANGVWVLLGTANYDGASPIVIEQTPTVQNSFVSQRSAAVLFERVPEPTTGALLALASLAGIAARRRR